ncbi:MAG: cbb3-type cytochrome c oxidase subunit I [Anaerolineae bacterium]|jgi:cytochrome c oxidase subunit 1|nr:cbb3-type cytochrome c oxidase subunit I [Anaerolineae bacterium]MDX9831022.1 cbb3-type cytochrome c oxidase subunit I [Anaerolineae bacterium]
MTFFSLGIVRGLVAQVLGTLLGMGLVVGIRALMGLEPWKAEPAAVIGAIVGTITFLIGAGTMSDWFKWVGGHETPLHHGPPRGRPAWMRYFDVDYSHKVIGIQYIVLSIFLLLVGGAMASIFRVELAAAGRQFLDPAVFNTMIGMHGWGMIVSILLGISGLANYLIPLLIGADDMAFPRLNAWAFWLNVPATLIFFASMVVGGWNTGWTGYPPLSAQAPLGMQMYFVSVFFFGISSITGAVNILTTILTMRAPGMSLFRMPILSWGILATNVITLTATQLIALSFIMVMLQRLLGMGFFDPAQGGNPILFQHLFWFYSHPAVYVFVLPGLGVISELLPVFARKPLFGYKWVALSSMAIALAGFLVWAHHMFTSGMESFLRVPFMFSTLLVAIPTGVKFFSWVGTIWGGKLSFPTPMLFVLGALSVFLIGGLSGPPNGIVTTDLFLHDTYWIVGHFHATMFGGFVFPFFAGLYYWFPKVTGRMYNERLGKLHFWLMTPAFWVQSLGQMQVGLLGMRRRIVDYDPALGIDGGQLAITIAAFVIGLSVVIAIANLAWSAWRGVVAERNPWRSRSPEWQIPSPVPELNYPGSIQVVGDPYDYGLPGSRYVKVPSTAPAAGD